MTLQVIQRLFDHARHRSDSEAFREVSADGKERVLTYAQFQAAVTTLADDMRERFPSGGVVMICYPNQLECVVAFFAGLAAGVTVFPVHPKLTNEELQTAAALSRATGAVGVGRARDALQSATLLILDAEGAVRDALRDTRAGSDSTLTAPAGAKANLLLQSSGTTGRPKIVFRCGDSLDAVARNVADSVELRCADRVLGLAPACHSYGVENVMLGPVWAGAAVELCKDLDTPRVLERLRRGKLTIFPGVPAMFEMLAELGDGSDPLTGLRHAYSAGANLPRAVFDAFNERFGVRVGQLYGMTEIGSVTFNNPHEEDHDPQSVGLPMEGVVIRIVDPVAKRLDRPLPATEEGEVAVSAPSMLSGYLSDDDRRWEAPDALVDGFLLTGDLGRLDGRGRLTITGRLKLVVDVGGLKVNLLEVEEALALHPAVEACAVTAVAVSETVSRLKAFVIPKEGEPAIAADEFRRHLRSKLSAHKVPRVFEIRSELPRSATGKILRHKL